MKTTKLSSVEEEIIKVASLFENNDEFKVQGRISALELGSTKIDELVKYFHKNPPEPEELLETTGKYGLFGVWMDVCQNAIFEILFNFGGEAIPKLHEIAFGEYDWTQYKAINTLCRLVNNGVESDDFLLKLEKHLPSFRYEAYIRVFYYLTQLGNETIVIDIYTNEFKKCLDREDYLTFVEIMDIWTERKKVFFPCFSSIVTQLAFGNFIPEDWILEKFH